MSFDIADLAQMEADGTLHDVIAHEMGHVLGVGTVWDLKGLLVGAGTANPTFVGPEAMAEFGALLGDGEAQPVPVENTGGPGTSDGHWRSNSSARHASSSAQTRAVRPRTLTMLELYAFSCGIM